MSHYKPYPSYKDSGVEWLGDVPEGWEIKPIYSFVSCNDDVLSDKTSPDFKFEYIDISSVDHYKGINEGETMSFSDSPSRARRLAKEGDVAVSTVRTYLKAIAAVDEKRKDAVYSTGFAILRAKEQCKSTFLKWLLLNENLIQAIESHSEGLSYPAINAAALLRLRTVLPGQREQIQIATALDRETTRIDTLVEKKTRFIELLKEKRQALITHAVTKGLDPNVKMKDSGVEWLGEVPEHWIIIQSRRLFEQRKEKAVSGDQQLTASQKHGIIFQKDFMSIENQKVVQVIIGAEILKHVEPNDFVISMRSFQGGLELSNLSGSISSAYVMLIPRNQVEPQYFKYLFKSITYIQALQSTSDLVRDGQALRYENFTKVPLPIFSKNEQLSIAKFLDGELARIDTLVEKTTRSIDLLKERRSALITAAVTGKIDVRREASLPKSEVVPA